MSRKIPIQSGAVEELTNERRANLGKQWLLAFPLADEYKTPEGYDFETMALDALADLYHFLNQCELPWEGITDEARMHFEVERDGFLKEADRELAENLSFEERHRYEKTAGLYSIGEDGG